MNKNLPFRIFDKLLQGQNNYQIAKRLNTSFALVNYHIKKIESRHIPLDAVKKIPSLIKDLVPIFEKHLGEFDYLQTEFMVEYLFYILNKKQNEHHPFLEVLQD